MIEFRTLPELPFYRFGSDGSVWSRYYPGRKGKNGGVFERWKKLKGCIKQSTGYIHHDFINSDGKRTVIAFHRLILKAFLGPAPAGMQCRHLDGNRTNNCLENLAWGTVKENSDDSFRHGTRARGCKQGSSKLTEEQVIEIRKRRENGELLSVLGREYGVHESMISKIALRKWWKHI